MENSTSGALSVESSSTTIFPPPPSSVFEHEIIPPPLQVSSSEAETINNSSNNSRDNSDKDTHRQGSNTATGLTGLTSVRVHTGSRYYRYRQLINYAAGLSAAISISSVIIPAHTTGHTPTQIQHTPTQPPTPADITALTGQHTTQHDRLIETADSENKRVFHESPA